MPVVVVDQAQRNAGVIVRPLAHATLASVVGLDWTPTGTARGATWESANPRPIVGILVGHYDKPLINSARSLARATRV